MYTKLISFFFAALLIAGCNATTSPGGTTTTEGSMVATVNGQAWSSPVLPIAGGIGTKAFLKEGTLTVTGVSTDLTAIGVTLVQPRVGTDSIAGTYATSDKKAYAGVGTANITKYDVTNRKISGTFSFTAYRVDSLNLQETVAVTNGSFLDVKWENQ
jgi:hypothetical protein